MRAVARPLVLLSAAAVLLLGVLAYFNLRTPPDSGPRPLPVADGEAEVVWLEPATTAASWEQFVAGVQQSQAAAEGLNQVASQLQELAAQYKV